MAVLPLIALTREVSASIAACQLTHLERQSIDLERARAQHAEYESALTRLGCEIRRLPGGPNMPDSVFIEDAAIVVDEIAVITHPGAVSRRVETAEVASVLSEYRSLVHVAAPGTIDGGDVLIVGRRVFVGRTRRTNDDGIEQLRRAVAPFGYTVAPRAVRGCLHLKSAATALDETTLLVNRRWVDVDEFTDFDLVDVDVSEPMAANIVRVGDRFVYSAAFPRTLERLIDRGCDVTPLDVSELAKAEGAVTCCSVIFRPHV